MLRTFFVVCLLSVLAIGCEQGRIKNVANIMMDTTGEEVIEIPEAEPELPTIDLNVEYESPGIPDGADILENDRVFHIKELDSSFVLVDDNGELTVESPYKELFFEPFVFEDALSALTDENVLTFFEWWELDLARQCQGGEIEILHVDFSVHFLQREEADKFAEQFEDIPPWSVLRNVYIIDGEKVYFAVHLAAHANREFCQ